MPRFLVIPFFLWSGISQAEPSLLESFLTLEGSRTSQCRTHVFTSSENPNYFVEATRDSKNKRAQYFDKRATDPNSKLPTGVAVVWTVTKTSIDIREYWYVDIATTLDKNDAKFFLNYSISRNGYLRLDLRTSYHDERSVVINAKRETERAIQFFKDRIVGISALWQFGDNLSAFSDNLLEGMVEDKAALKTWTGQLAGAHGFSKIKNLKIERDHDEFSLINQVSLNFIRP